MNLFMWKQGYTRTVCANICICGWTRVLSGQISPLSLLGDEITTVYVTWLHQIDRFRRTRLFFPMERNEMTLQCGKKVLPFTLRSYLP